MRAKAGKSTYIIHSNGKKCDDYMTPKYAWENIKHLVDKKYKVVYESAYGDGKSGKYLQEVFPNKTIIHKNMDYFEREFTDYDIEISNPPFSIAKEWLTEAKARGKPFILIMPTQKLTTQYFQKLFAGEKIQIVIPRKRIHFLKIVDGKVPEGWKNACSFDCFYYTWKLGFKDDITWLD